MHPDIKTLNQHLHEVPDCSLFLKIYTHRQLLRAQKFIGENETIGRYEHVAGLFPQCVIPIGETRARSLPCIGSEEIMDAGKQLHTLPGLVKTITGMDVLLTNCQVFVPKREAFELRMIESLYNQYKRVSKSEIKVLTRTLKIGLHNGHTVVNGHWVNQILLEDIEDRDMLLSSDSTITIPSFVPDAYMSLVFIVEYQLGVQASNNNHIDSYSIIHSKANKNKVISMPTIGVATYIPCDGKRLLLSNTGRGVAEEGVDVEVKIVKDELCSILNPTHLMMQAGDMRENNRPENANATTAVADSKVKDRLSYIGDEKLRSSTQQNLRASTTSNNESVHIKADVPSNLGAMIGLDLKVIHPVIGKVNDGEYIDELLKFDESKHKKSKSYSYDEDNKEAARRSTRAIKEPTVDLSGSGAFKSSRQSFRVTKERFERPSYISDQDSSVSESLVTGDSDKSHVRLNSLYYGGRREKKEESDRGEEDIEVYKEDDRSAPRRDRGPAGQSDLYLHSMYAKLTRPGEPAEDVPLRQRDRGHLLPTELYAERHVANKTSVPHQRNEFFIRNMTRGAKTRLNRHGITDVITDTADYFLQQEEAYKDASAHGYQRSVLKKPSSILNNYNAMGQRVDLYKEAEDELNISEINIQFVGYRAAVAENSTDLVFHAPRSIYCSFQFYACQPTRTEAMSLLDADKGSVHVLVRDEPSARRDPPLVLRYIVDNSKTSMYESYEFAGYLAQKSIYIDVWDADSMIYLGTVGIPCKLFMRQGAPYVKHAVEVDIINGESNATSRGGITTMVILDNGPLVGERVGSLSVMLSNQGVKGKKRPNDKQIFHKQPMEGLNWRAHATEHSTPSQTNRPKNIVRARPLTETAPELSQALTSLREQVRGVSFRSLAASRGAGGMSTLNYDEVVILFKRFAGDKKGTVQYNGDLLVLMDLPSMSIMVKKLVKATKAFGDTSAVRKLLLRHCNSAEEMSAEDTQEFLRVLFEKTSTKSKPEDRSLLAAKVIEQCGVDKSHVSVTKVLSYIAEETDKLDWTLVSTRLKLCVQRAVLEGLDVEQTLCDYDVQDSKFIGVKDFKEFLNKVSVYGKLSYPDVNLAVRIFARHGRGLEDRGPVSLQEFLAFIGMDYVGNLQARVKKLVQASADQSVDAKTVLRLLKEGQESKNTKGMYTYDTVKGVFRALGLYNILSHDQVEGIIKKLDVKKSNMLSAEQVMAYLGVTFSAQDLKGGGGGDKLSLDIPEPNVIVDAEYLLKLLLDKVRSNGVAVDEAFRHFDTNGDGFISPQEFEQGLKQLAIFDHLTNWKAQLAGIVSKFDQSNDGLVSLKEFFAFLGIQDYAPNIVQRLTKVFALATLQGLSFEDIFVELDENKDGTLDANEIIQGCGKLGTFGHITLQDAQSVVKIFDDNGDNTISLAEFVTYFKDRVAQDLKLRKLKNGAKVAKRFREVMSKAQEKGATTKDIFRHFDKDQGGSVNTTELTASLRSLPFLKALSAQDIQDLIAAIDIDNSGDVTLDEFDTFINGHANKGGGSTNVSIFERIRETFAAAEKKGLSFEKAFNVIDKDKNAQLSLLEFEQLLKKIPTFKDIVREEIIVHSLMEKRV
ncbi:hypothetical protein EON64_03285 [archaeon]|nr:MAG: hypothetical protein EON64_03285 [archaeon]